MPLETSAASNPTGACELRPQPDLGPYGNCNVSLGQYDGDYFEACPAAPTTWLLEDWDACAACICDVPCNDEECPLPKSGDASPVCRDGACVLPCDDGERCPDGMQCTEVIASGKYCLRLHTKDNSLTCAFEEEPDLCSTFSTQAECEARIDNDPSQPRVACLWATVSTFATGNEGCNPLMVEEKCVIAELPDPTDIPESPRCGDTFVHWQDLGAGTATLTEISRCGYEPIDTTPCEFGDPTVPFLCNCACGGVPSAGDYEVNAIPPAMPTGEICAPKRESSVGPYGYCATHDPLSADLFDWPDTDLCPQSATMSTSFRADNCSFCACLLDCEGNADCPPVESGDVVPVCENGHCRLPCAAGSACPDGMHCNDLSRTGGYCQWVDVAEYGKPCQLLENACSELTTQESCEAGFHATPGEPTIVCLWATESIYSTTITACDAVAIEGRCIFAGLNREVARAPASHRCGDVSVFWRDLGAGTSMLLEIEACGYVPLEQDLLDYEPCQLGDPSIPQLCSCGCQ